MNRLIEAEKKLKNIEDEGLINGLHLSRFRYLVELHCAATAAQNVFYNLARIGKNWKDFEDAQECVEYYFQNDLSASRPETYSRKDILDLEYAVENAFTFIECMEEL